MNHLVNIANRKIYMYFNSFHAKNRYAITASEENCEKKQA